MKKLSLILVGVLIGLLAFSGIAFAQNHIKVKGSSRTLGQSNLDPSTLNIISNLSNRETTTAQDNPCHFIKTEDGHMVNPRHIAVIQSLTLRKIDTGSNLNRYHIFIVMADGTRVFYRGYEWESQRDSYIIKLTYKVEGCLDSQ
jgi:hypothetical protein